jgi:hypothetical protein
MFGFKLGQGGAQKMNVLARLLNVSFNIDEKTMGVTHPILFPGATGAIEAGLG